MLFYTQVEQFCMRSSDADMASIDAAFSVSMSHKIDCNLIVYGFVRRNCTSFDILIPNDLINCVLNYYCFQIEKIKLNMSIDFERNDGKYVCAKVIDISTLNSNHSYQIEYEDNNNKTKKVWIDKKNAYNKFENFESISMRKSKNKINCNISSLLRHSATNSNDKKSYFIKVKPLSISSKDMNEWIESQIDCIANNSDQIRVCFKSNGKEYTCWVHLDNSMQVETSSIKIRDRCDNSNSGGDESSDDSSGYINYNRSYKGYGDSCSTCGSTRNVKQIWSGSSYCGQCRYDYAVYRKLDKYYDNINNYSD